MLNGDIRRSMNKLNKSQPHYVQLFLLTFALSCSDRFLIDRKRVLILSARHSQRQFTEIAFAEVQERKEESGGLLLRMPR